MSDELFGLPVIYTDNVSALDVQFRFGTCADLLNVEIDLKALTWEIVNGEPRLNLEFHSEEDARLFKRAEGKITLRFPSVE